MFRYSLTKIIPRSTLTSQLRPLAVRSSQLQLGLHQYQSVNLRLKSQPSFQSRRTVITSNVDWKPIKTTDKEEWTLSKYIFLSLLILMPVISFMLGTWQLRRLKWKNNLIASSEDRLTYDPIPLPKNFDPEDAEDWQYRRVIVKGKFDHSREVFVGPKIKNEQKGYTLYTPLVRSDGGPDVLIERGFVTDNHVIPGTRSLHHLSVPMHEVEVECIIKMINPKPRITMQKTDPESRLWHVLDYNEMAEFTGCIPLHLAALVDLKDHPIETVPVTEPKPWWKVWASAKTHKETHLKDIKPEEVQEFSQYQFMNAGVPIGRTATIDFRNNHLQYIVTWYGLCFASSILLFIVLKKKPKDPMKDKLRHAHKFM